MSSPHQPHLCTGRPLPSVVIFFYIYYLQNDTINIKHIFINNLNTKNMDINVNFHSSLLTHLLSLENVNILNNILLVCFKDCVCVCVCTHGPQSFVCYLIVLPIYDHNIWLTILQLAFSVNIACRVLHITACSSTSFSWLLVFYIIDTMDIVAPI